MNNLFFFSGFFKKINITQNISLDPFPTKLE